MRSSKNKHISYKKSKKGGAHSAGKMHELKELVRRGVSAQEASPTFSPPSVEFGPLMTKNSPDLKRESLTMSFLSPKPNLCPNINGLHKMLASPNKIDWKIVTMIDGKEGKKYCDMIKNFYYRNICYPPPQQGELCSNPDKDDGWFSQAEQGKDFVTRAIVRDNS